MTEIQNFMEKYKLKDKEITFCDIFDPIPINSGGDWYRYFLIDELSNNNELMHIYTTKLDKEGYNPPNINFERKYVEGGTKFNNLFNKISPKIGLIKPEFIWNYSELKDIKTDIVFTIAETYHIANYIAKKNNAPIILVMHNLEWEYLKNIGSSFYVPMKLYEDYLLKKVDAIIAISSRESNYAAEKTSAEIFTVPPKLYSIFKPEGEKFIYGSDKLNILFYGSLDREQNIEALEFINFELIPLLKSQKIMDDIRINIFGSGKPPEYLNIEKNPDINYLGTVNEPSKYIRGADVVIVPLKNSAGIKIRVLEALGCKKTIIATPEAVKNLATEFKKKVFVEKTAIGFLNIINDYRINFKNAYSK